MDKKIHTLRVQKYLRHKVPPAADTVHKVGDKVIFYLERQVKNRVDECVGPFYIKGVDIDWKLTYFQDRKQPLRRNLDSLK